MATVAQLAARTYQDVGYLLVIEGWPVAWTDRVELVGTGGDSWIGQDEDEEDRVVALGLEPPETIKLATGIVDSGMLIDDGAEFALTDRDGHLVAFAQDEPGDLLYERLAPGDDPAPATLIGAGGESVNLHGRHVNGEAIGAAGERRLYQILPGGSLPGYDYAAIDTDAGRSTLRASSVRDDPRWLEGRPCALYLIRRDTDDGSWPAWSEQHTSGYSLIWWGTVKALRAEGHEWRLECEGPSSWLRRTLNVNRPAEWRRFAPLLELAPGQDLIAASLFYRDAPGAIPVRCGTSAFDPVDDVLTSGQTPAELAQEIHTRLQALVSTAGLDATFDSHRGGAVTFHDLGFEIKVNDNVSGSGFAEGGICMLRMHQLVWLHLGWDLSFAVQGVKSMNDLGSLRDVWAYHGSSFNPAYNVETADPAPGYWTALFTTWPLGIGDGKNDPMRADGDGAVRPYQPVYPGGGVALLYPEADQTWDLELGLDAPYLEGQLAQPPADKVIGSGTCDAAGFIAVRGTRTREVDGEVETVYQIARVSWVDDDDRVGLEALTSRALVWADAWLDPAAWGSASDKLSGVWAANDLEYVPVALLGGYNLSTPDHAHRVLARLMLSSGTAAWSGVGDGATISAGDNAHPDAGGGKADDLEIADLGLCIPASMIDLLSFRAAAEALPEGVDGPMNRTRLAFVGPFDSQEVIENLIKPRGWCFSLRGGMYGLFARSEPLDAADVEVAITPADVAGDPAAMPPDESVDFRPLEPVDLITVSYGASQIGGDGRERTVTIKARDARAQSRRGNAKVDVEGRTLTADGAWLGEFTQLWGDQLATFYAEPRAMVRVTVKGDAARDLWPGTIVSYTSSWAATRDGSYGMTSRLGRVVSVERDLQSLAATVEILVDAGDPTAARRFGPITRLVDDADTVEERHDAASRTVFCYADAFGRGGSARDVTAFAEPSWSTTGGALLAYVWQSWDGLTWEKTAEFEVESVNATANSITYAAGTLKGTIWERRWAIVTAAPYDDQDANEWPRALFGVVCDSDGKFGAGNLAGFPWVE